MTLSDLAKLVTTRSIARRLCDSWGACLKTLQFWMSGHTSKSMNRMHDMINGTHTGIEVFYRLSI